MPATTALFWLAALTLALWVIGALNLALGTRRIGFLREVPPLSAWEAPSISVVIAARDEARKIEEALGSVLHQDYRAFEVVVVDDRSSDATGAILDRMAAEHPHLKVIHLTALPPDWLGKNHALMRGAGAARGEWLLFTDADVVMRADTLARAIGFVTRERVDHLAVAPELRMPGMLLDLFAGSFALFFSQFTQPWKARDPKSPRHIGIGAFNLVRASAYRAVGGHAPIAMRPDDDLMLGKLLKKHGFRQDMLFGPGMISVEWYGSLGEAVRGLEKNAFAGAGYSVAVVVASALALLVLNVWPFAALFLTAGAVLLLNAATVAVILALYAASTRASGSDPLLGIGVPFATLFLIYVVARSTWLALKNNGIDWRGTHYPLSALRANRV